MKVKCQIITGLIFFMSLFVSNSIPAEAANDILLGINWGDSRLVSFDPYAGVITEVHGQLNPNEGFRGLAYDSNHNKLYALAQGTNNLYYIDPATMNIVHIGNLHINSYLSWGKDAGAIAYDSVKDILYVVVEHWESNSTNYWSELCIVNVNNAELTNIGNIYGPFISSLAYNEQDGQLYGLALYGPDSPDNSYVVRINPSNASMEQLFETPYHTIMGLAKKPGEDVYIYYSWINWTSHFYGEINLQTQTIIPLADADQIMVISAMVYKDFYVGSAPLLPTIENPISFLFVGHVTEISDADNLLGGVNTGSIFKGSFSYDINGIINGTNRQSPYGVSVAINNIPFSSTGFHVGVLNNYYDTYTGEAYDSFGFYADRVSNPFPFPSDDIYIDWGLTDYSLQDLSNNIFLPDNFDLSVWDKNDFYVYGKFYPNGWDQSSIHFHLSGVLDRIYRLPLSATIDFEPSTLNLRSKGKWITCYIELPDGFLAEQIDPTGVVLSIGGIPLTNAQLSPIRIGDYDADGKQDLMVKFERTSINALIFGDVKITVTGNLFDGTPFSGTDTIKVIENQK